MDYSRPDLANRLAADYVVGLLHGRARRRFEALLPAHAALRAALRSWNEYLMPLTASLAPVPPPARIWRRIEARISGGVAAPAPASWWGRLALWRAISGVATLATLSLALLLALPGPVPAPIIVVLDAATPAPAGATPASFIASISGDGRALVTRPLNVSVQADRALELWAVPPSGAPRSLGLVSAGGATVVRRGRLLEGTAALAVSLEPPGGSPSGAPSGPILYVGKLNL
jgi:anti-sigma-K factor RskA